MEVLEGTIFNPLVPSDQSVSRPNASLQDLPCVAIIIPEGLEWFGDDGVHLLLPTEPDGGIRQL